MNIIKKNVLILFLTALLLLTIDRSYHFIQQKKIADKLDIDLHEYDRKGFPINYFSQYFDESFSREEVLNKVQGFEKHCYIEQWNSDFFYFYSSDWQDKDVIVLQIEYKEGMFFILATRDVKWENFGPCG